MLADHFASWTNRSLLFSLLNESWALLDLVLFGLEARPGCKSRMKQIFSLWKTERHPDHFCAVYPLEPMQVRGRDKFTTTTKLRGRTWAKDRRAGEQEEAESDEVEKVKGVRAGIMGGER